MRATWLRLSRQVWQLGKPAKGNKPPVNSLMGHECLVKSGEIPKTFGLLARPPMPTGLAPSKRFRGFSIGETVLRVRGVESKKPGTVEAAETRKTAKRRLFDSGGQIGGAGPGGRNAGLGLVVAPRKPRAGVLPGRTLKTVS